MALVVRASKSYLWIMFQSFLNRLFPASPARLPEPDARLALAGLMVRIARSDGDYAWSEQSRIDRVLAQYHGLTPADATQLRRDAEAFEAQAPDTVRFTRVLKDAVAPEDRAALLGALWSIALADGGRAAEEDGLMRLIVNLLGLSDVDSALARQRVAQGDK